MKFHNIFRRSFSMLLCLCMVLSMGFMPSAADAPATRAASAFESSKNINNGGDNDPKTYTIDIDAIVNGSVTQQVSSEPLDVSIVFDRSDSMSFPADPDTVKTFTSYSQVKSFLNTLKPDQLWDGYYRASNIAHTGGVFYQDKAVTAEKYISWEPIRYNKSNSTWETFVTEGAGGINGIEGPHGIVRSKDSRYAPYYGSWVSLESAFNTFKSRQSYVTATTGFKFSIAIPGLTKAQIALEEFIRGLDKTADNLPANQYHTVSVVSFGGSVFVNNYTNALDGRSWTYKDSFSGQKFAHKVSITKQTLAGSRGTTAQKNGVNGLINDIIRNPYTQGPTYTNLAFEYLASNANYLPAAKTGRNRVVILLTDGTPTDSMLFLKDYADGAIKAALGMKNGGVSVYTLGYMKGISASGSYQTHADTNSEARKAQNFLHLMSSNYPKASSMTSSGSKTGKDYFMADTGDGTNLLGHFKSILEKISTVYVSPLPGAKDSVSIYDEITREFVIDTDKKVKVYIQKYNGNGSFAATKEYIGEHALSATKDATFNGANGAYKLYWDCDIDKSDPAQPKVDLNISSIRLNWLDAKYAALRETAVTNAGSSYPSYTKGYKIGIELPIEVDDKNTIGGNNILTNTAVSGLYKSTTDDTTNQPDFTKNVIKYPSPNVNVEADFSALVYDYFMDLETMVANLNAGVDSTFAQAIFAAMLQDPSTLLSYLNNNKNDYVNLSITLEDLYALLANAGADAFTATGAASGASFDYTLDQILDALVKLTYTSNKTDSIGVAPFQNVSTTMHPNYYGPKYVVVDFDETVKTPLNKEGGLSPALQSGVTNGKIEGSNICYNFRANYASGAKSYLEKNYTTVKYQVTAPNGTKPASGTAGVKTVKRNFYVIPANVMTYDDTFLSYINGGWETVGTYTDSEQSHDNAVIHGYDALYNSTYSKDYYHNALKAVTVSSAKSTAQATFNFTGTGFDIFAQTSPNSGTLVVEVSNDSAFKNVTKTYLVDTYLKDATLNQIPVVRLDGLTYGTWYVRITAFYDKVFDHNYTRSMRGAVPTEEKLREMLGIAADADFTFVPSASGYDHQDTRAIANAKNGQYNVYIDGIRVYNTLGTGLNAVATYAYAQAGEGVANILNINDALVDASNANTWADSAVSGINGVLYTAASNSTSTETAVTDGIILGLEGALYTKQDGSKFYVFKDAACTQNIKYNGKNVYYRKQTLTSPITESMRV